MAKVPFTVSARAARLIGRENVASAQGAITELVKNCYDADARICAVLFRRRWNGSPSKVSARELNALEKLSPGITDAFTQDNDLWAVSGSIDEPMSARLNAVFDQVVDLWIVDNGHGMSTDVIEKQWMVIGTDTKEIDSTSRGGRVYTGAKGIGRFALDRLGQECELYSAEDGALGVVHWLVDWAQFDGAGKTISEVEAILETESTTLGAVYSSSSIADLLPACAPQGRGDQLPIKYSQGTAIKISLLNDNWDLKDSQKLTETLDALLPPDDRGGFNIFVHDERSGEAGAFIDNFPPDQFDYRMNAEVREDGSVSIKLVRQEIDVANVRESVYLLDGMDKSPYRREDIVAGEVEYSTDLKSILKGDEIADQAAEIGPFSLVMYFFKLTNPNQDNLRRFPQKNFDVGKRKRWVDRSGGIRLYRDGFRVRPYGEPKTSASDWLLLGDRALRNPVQASKIGWRVPPTQVAGTINITRRLNPLLADRSNREGVVNERALDAFRKIITALIREFERDRAYILSKFSLAYDLDNPVEQDVHEGKKIANRVLRERARVGNRGSETAQDGSTRQPENSDLQKVSMAFDEQVRENESLRDHIQVMRGMATLGTVLISFTHELKQIKATVELRAGRLEKSIAMTSDQQKADRLPADVRPSALIERMRSEDRKVSRWVNFALSAVSSSKRRRQRIEVYGYLHGVEAYWSEFLQSRNIKMRLEVAQSHSLAVLAHEIDLDTVFYNLITNSIEALVKPSGPRDRQICIRVEEVGSVARFNYSDNGPGLSSTLNAANDIFMFGISSKKEEFSGAAAGTGLGMWLLKNVVDDFGGAVTLGCEVGKECFAIEIDIPRHIKE
jgi:signal transduction histidine kinase